MLNELRTFFDHSRHATEDVLGLGSPEYPIKTSLQLPEPQSCPQ